MSLTFIPLGIGDAFSKTHYSSCLAVMSEGGAVLVDCPHPIRKMLAEADGRTPPLDIGDFDAVVLTHLHADHASGVEGFLFFSRFRLNRKGVIVAHPNVMEQLWTGHLVAGMGEIKVDGARREMTLADYAKTEELDDTSPVRVGPFSIECRRTKHHIPTYALKIHADGVCLGYSADTKFDPALIEWLSSADLIIHETNEGIHTPYEKLAALPEARRKKMRLIHFLDDFDRETSAIEPLVQGRAYTVSSTA